MDSYRTISAPTEGIYKEKGSKFLSFAFPVKEEEDARHILEEMRKKYHDARHVCFAYQTGTDSPLQRTSDDGEPSHTAGQPILGQIQSFGLHNILVVVVRYFGGILLGTGGLIRAYKTAARNALEKAEYSVVTMEDRFDLRFAYEDLSPIMRILHEEEASLLSQEYADRCRILFRLARNKQDACLKRLSLLSSVSLIRESGE